MLKKKPITPIQGHGTETVVVTATVRTRSVASASAASAAVTKLLESSSKTTDTFRMPVKSVEQLPMVVSEAPHSPATRQRLHSPSHSPASLRSAASPSTHHPLMGLELQHAIVDALTSEESLVEPREHKKSMRQRWR
jgi:hypothetical protein